MSIELGKKYRDSITGFSGIATGKAEYLYSCRRVELKSTELNDGRTIEAEWFDEQRLAEVGDSRLPADYYPSVTDVLNCIEAGPVEKP